MGKILVVDDDQGTTKLLELILSREGYDVVAVNNSCDTLTTALMCDPNLILLDLVMPSLDGFEVCRNVREKSQFAHTPIIFFTSVGDVEKKVIAFGLGATDYIVKPVHPQELKLRIKALIGNGNGSHKGM
jgi:DNA-binding response OmpR family regulator